MTPTVVIGMLVLGAFLEVWVGPSLAVTAAPIGTVLLILATWLCTLLAPGAIQVLVGMSLSCLAIAWSWHVAPPELRNMVLRVARRKRLVKPLPPTPAGTRDRYPPAALLSRMSRPPSEAVPHQRLPGPTRSPTRPIIGCRP